MKTVKIKMPKSVEEIPLNVLEYCRHVVAGDKLEWYSNEGLHRLNKKEKTISVVERSELFNQESFDFSVLAYSAIGYKYIDVSDGVPKPYAPTESDKKYMREIITDIPPKLWVSPTGLHAIDVGRKEVALLIQMPGYTESSFLKNQRIFESIGFAYVRAPEGDPRAAGMKERADEAPEEERVGEEIGAPPKKKKKKKRKK